MALIYFICLMFERVLETYWAGFQTPEPTIIILEEEPPEPVAMAA
jgi:hypothetical protein